MKFYFVATLLIQLIFGGVCYANGLMREAMGSIPGGRGGTNIAHTDNGMLVYDNPAALSEVNGKMAEFDFDNLDLMPNYENAANDESGDVWTILPSLSYMQELNDRFGIGVGVYHPAGCQSDYGIAHPLFGEQEYSSFASLTELLFAVGFSPIDSLSIGVGIGPAYSKMKLKEPYTFQTGTLQGVPVLIDMKVDDEQLTWNAGLQWRVSNATTFGIVYHPERKFNMEGDIDLDLNVVGVALGFPDTTATYDLEYDVVWPQTAAIGVAHQFTDALNLSAEAVWYGWSSAFDKWELKLSNGDNPVYNAAAGTTTPQDTIPLEWDDAYSIRVGGDYALTENDTIRLGYIYEKNPIPNDTLVPVIPAICQHEILAGYSHDWEKLSVTMAYGYIFGPSQDIETSKLVGGDYNNSTIDFSAHFISLGLQYQVLGLRETEIGRC